MLEPPQAGFTGTMWNAVPPQQLATELGTGPGPGPMAEAGVAYSALALGLAGAGTEYRALLTMIGTAWASESNGDGLAQLALLADWFDDITAAATENAAVAAEQAVSYEIAHLAMPHLGELTAAIDAAKELVSGTLLGAPLAGMLDQAEHQVDELGDLAARVMATYESASTQLATPWEQDPAPMVSAAAAMLAEQAFARPSDPPQTPEPKTATVEPETLTGSVPTIDLSNLHLPAPTPTVAVGPETLVMTPVVSPTAPITTTVAPQLGSAISAASGVPPLVAPPTTPAATSSTTPFASGQRASAAEAEESANYSMVEAGFATAPAVLGGVRAAAGSGDGAGAA